MTAIEKSHVARGGQSFLALAPTTRARDALKESGFEVADTVQRFLVSETMQVTAVMRVILVDEAGLLSTEQLDALTQKVSDLRARLLLVGDTKQHYCVQRGDGLRNVVKNAGLPIVRLTEVLRQRNQWDRNFSRMLAEGDAGEAILFAERRGLLREVSRDDAMFKQAADHYVANCAKGIDTLVVIPFWEEIYRFNDEARPALRGAGLLGDSEVVRTAVKPLSWTQEQKRHWQLYQPGDRLLFTRKTRSFARGTTVEIVKIATDGLVVRDSTGREFKITKKQRAAFEVSRAETLAVSVGDRLLIRGRDDTANLTNGDLREVTAVDSATNEVELDNGKFLPREFTAWTYGHAVTSYRAQGSTSEESILVLDSTAAQKLSQRELYVGNTRYRGAHAIYVTNTEKLYQRLAWREAAGRELASEFVQRQRWAMQHDHRVRQQQSVQQTQRI